MNEDAGEPRDYLKLHFLVFVWGFTGVMGELIDLPAVELVLFRCLIATAMLAWIVRRSWRVSWRHFAAPRRRSRSQPSTG